jgi:predicted nuclease of restriction endonuclease-like (RecB) superfamily
MIVNYLFLRGADRLARDIRQLIETARSRVAQTVNAGVVILYWQIGKRIRQDILKAKRAEYGVRIVQTLSAQLVQQYGTGFSRRNLFNMIRFAQEFPDIKIVQTLSGQLSWSHFLEILTVNDPLKREFYAELCRVEHWSVRSLREKVRGMLYERTAISRRPEQVVKKDLQTLREADRMSPDLVFRDPYLLDFLDLKEAYSEKDLESAILREIQAFLLELGQDFAFLARQKRITIDDQDYFIDLLFFHRRLRCLVAIDLKLGRFQAQDKGQMELYLRWLQKHQRRPDESSPIGLILCAGKGPEHVELLQLEKDRIHVADYLTVLPPRHLLEERLHRALQAARERFR